MQSKSGVYQIINTVNNKRYIGSAVDLRKRENEHFAHLRRGAHHSSYLQRAYNKHGRDAFHFEVLMYTPRDHCIIVEQAVLDAVKPEYNLSKRADSRLGAPQPKSMAKAQSKRMKERWANMSVEERAEMSSKTSREIKGYWKDRNAEERVAAAKKASIAAHKRWQSLPQEERDRINAIKGKKSKEYWASRSLAKEKQ